MAKVKHTFIAKYPGEISLTKGDTVKVNRKIDENWYEGQSMFGTVGIFPCAYVELVKNPLANELDLDDIGRATTPIFRTLTPTNLSPQSCKITRSGGTPTNKFRTTFDDNLTPLSPYEVTRTPPTPLRREKMYKVLYSYFPRQSDELELIPSDLINVSLECGDGWLVGRSTLTGKYGAFPSNYVERVY